MPDRLLVGSWLQGIWVARNLGRLEVGISMTAHAAPSKSDQIAELKGG